MPNCCAFITLADLEPISLHISIVVLPDILVALRPPNSTILFCNSTLLAKCVKLPVITITSPDRLSLLS